MRREAEGWRTEGRQSFPVESLTGGPPWCQHSSGNCRELARVMSGVHRHQPETLTGWHRTKVRVRQPYSSASPIRKFLHEGIRLGAETVESAGRIVWNRPRSNLPG